MAIRIIDGSEPTEGFYRFPGLSQPLYYLSQGRKGWVLSSYEEGELKHHEESPLETYLEPVDPEEVRGYHSAQIKFIDDMLRRQEFKKRNGLVESAQSSPLETESPMHSQKVEDISRGC